MDMPIIVKLSSKEARDNRGIWMKELTIPLHFLLLQWKLMVEKVELR